MMQLKMHGFWAIIYVCQEMVLRSQQPHGDGCWTSFSCSWGTEGGPTDPRPGTRHTLQPGQPPSSSTWGHSCSPPGALQARTSNRSHVAERKSYWCWKIAERCQLRRRTANVRLLCDVFFLTTRPRHSENFNEKLKLAGALNGAPAAWKKELLQNCGRMATHRNYQETRRKCIVT
jgi:hypothetical protein